jgi:hypothetical protein
MNIDQLQGRVKRSVLEMKTPFRSGAEIVVALTEEFG